MTSKKQVLKAARAEMDARFHGGPGHRCECDLCVAVRAYDAKRAGRKAKRDVKPWQDLARMHREAITKSPAASMVDAERESAAWDAGYDAGLDALKTCLICGTGEHICQGAQPTGPGIAPQGGKAKGRAGHEPGRTGSEGEGGNAGAVDR